MLAPAPPWGNEPVPQLGLGRPGKDGLLDLRVGLDEPGGRTALRALRHRPPLQLGRLLYPDEGCPRMAYAYVAMLAGGLVQGDRLGTHIHLEPGAQAHVTTLAATKIYRMERNGAAQHLELAVGAGAFLEWWPDPLIPFRGARLWQEAACTVHPEGTLLYGDLLLPGRAGAGERHEYAYYRSRVSARRPNGTLLFTDTQALAPPPPGARAPRPALPSGLHGIGTAYILSRVDTLAGLLGAVREALCGPAPAAAGGAGRAGAGHVLGGASLLPGDCGLVVRFLAPDGRAGRCAMASIRAAARRWLLGSAPPAPRKL